MSIILKGEKLCGDRKICDCLIFKDENEKKIIVGLAELKSKTVHVNEIREKLQNATQIVLEILKECTKKKEIKFYCLVLSKRWNSNEYKMLTTKIRIQIKGKKQGILPKRCGIAFSDIISKY